MNDRRSLLEREMDRVELRPFPLDRFYRRRDRKRRNQQIAAIVVAIAIFAAPLWIFATGGPYDRSQTPAASVAAASDRVVIGLPPE